MISFAKPNFTLNIDFNQEVQNLLTHKASRGLPEKSNDKLLICTWNIANLGLHDRHDDHYKLIAEILSWFDIIAIQEVYDNLNGLNSLDSHLPSHYDILFSDKGGNSERAAYAYNSRKVERLQMVGELAIPQADQRFIKLPGNNQKFKGFDRNPYIATFQFKNTNFTLVNAHLYFGSDSSASKKRRALEAFAVGRYCDLRRKSVNAFTDNIMALGDFNIPMAVKGDLIYDALSKRGLITPDHSTRLASSISTDAQYDQVVFFPNLKRKITNNGVFDYDDVIFPHLWQSRPRSFKSYCRYYISDHRPMWVEVEF